MAIINGEQGATISVEERGLHYGDGLFETLAVWQGKPMLWDRHMERLQQGCQRIGLPSVELERLYEEALQACGGAQRGVLKIVITRGRGGRGYRPAASTPSTRIVAMYPWPDYPHSYYHQGIALGLCRTRLGHNPALAGMKHLNRLEQVLARSEWDDPQVPEGLMLDINGDVIEGTMTNLFMVHDGTLYTPDLTNCGVAGVMRHTIIDMAAALRIPVEIKALKLQELKAAAEIFVCNSIIGVWPVAQFDGQPLGARVLGQRIGTAVLEAGYTPTGMGTG